MDNPLATMALAAALAWASGIRLYAAVFILGASASVNWISLPANLQVLAHPYVIGTAGVLVMLEFLADKIPGIDSLWDALQTFVRIPAGALLAAGVIGVEDGAAWAIVAGLIGGTITAGTHFAKAGSRALLNTSPEPISNWTASFTEDAAIIGGLWLALTHPLIFLILLAVFIGLVIWLLPLLWRGMRAIFRRLAGLSGAGAKPLP